MEAIILAAGLGTRLRPLTNDRPKALVEVGSRSLLQINIEQLEAQGFDHIVINTHHFSPMIRSFVDHYHGSCHLSLSDESDQLLDTGGALRRIAQRNLLSGAEPYVVHNVDILSRIDMHELVASHMQQGAIATLSVSRRSTDRQLLFDNDSHLIGWHNRRTDEYRWSREPASDATELAYSGIAVVSAEFMQLIACYDAEKFSLIDFLLHAASTHPVGLYEHSPADWLDVGKPETLASATKFLSTM